MSEEATARAVVMGMAATSLVLAAMTMPANSPSSVTTTDPGGTGSDMLVTKAS